MRLFFLPLLLPLLGLALNFQFPEDDYLDVVNNFYDNEIPDFDVGKRRLAQGPMPKTAPDMMYKFNKHFITYLHKAEKSQWNQLVQIMSPEAYIETCMESAYGLTLEQFHKWMTHLSKFYLEVSMTSTMLKDKSDYDVTTELIYKSVIRGDIKRVDKWTMSATFDEHKGYFVINTLKMLSDCTTIPKTPPLEPAIPAETFISSLKNKLVNDIFLDGGLHYKSAYESMFTYLNPVPFINVCDVGKMSSTQFVEYWNKRYGKIQAYKDHKFEVTHAENKTHFVDFAVTYPGTGNSFFRDSYRFKIQKWANLNVEYFENFADWTIVNVQQYCTETKTKMTKSDESLHKMALASRRWDQLFQSELQWDTQQAFKEMFEQKSFSGYACNRVKFDEWNKFETWLADLTKHYIKSLPMQTSVSTATESKVGFWILNTLTARSDNSTSNHRVYYEGYYKDDNWQLNHLGFACNE